MRSLAEINRISDEAAENANQKNLQPYVFWDNRETKLAKRFPFPFLGDHVPYGWELLGKPLFADLSGFGAPDEPALTEDQLKDKIVQIQDENDDVSVGWGIVEVGQFQGYIQAFVKVKK